MSAEPRPGFELVEARHIDALTEALHVNARLLTQQALREVRLLALLERVAVATEHAATHTANLPALVELMTARTNGASHHEENADAGPNPR